jgi:hypothetical protein
MKPPCAWRLMTPRPFTAARPRFGKRWRRENVSFRSLCGRRLPKVSKATRALAADLITMTFSAVGKQFSEAPRTLSEIETYADAMADMFCAYLRALEHG